MGHHDSISLSLSFSLFCESNSLNSPFIWNHFLMSRVEHEASTSKISEDQLFYFQQRGIDAEEAVGMIISGFCREVFQELPMEFAAEVNQLMSLKLEGSVG